MPFLLTFLALMHISPFITARCLLRWRPHWRRWVIALASASVVPALLLIPLAAELVRAMHFRQRDCGIDPSCIEVEIAWAGLIVMVLVLFGCSLLVSSLIVYPLPSSRYRESGKTPP